MRTVHRTLHRMPSMSGRRSLRTLLLTSLLAVGASAVQAQRGPTSGALFVGRVLDQSTERPIANARIELRDLKLMVLADSSGAYRIRGIAPGAHSVVVRAIGFDSISAVITFRGRDSVDTDMLMSSNVNTLSLVRVEAKLYERYGFRLREFDDRRAFGFGRFLDWQYFVRNAGRPVGPLLTSRIPSLRTRMTRGMEVLTVEGRGRNCLPQVIMNGLVFRDFDLTSINAEDIIGFEYHTTSTTPLQYNMTGNAQAGAHCGTAIFWTKW